MHSHLSLLALVLVCGPACGQASASSPAPTPSLPPTASPSTGPVALSQHILVEDSAVRIDEQRRGGETQSISVQPKGGMPAYQVAPKTGERSWKVLGF